MSSRGCARRTVPNRDPRRPAAGRPTILYQVPKHADVSYQPVDADGLLLVELAGELDLDDADEVRDSLAAAAGRPDCRYLRVDVSKVTFIDSYALGALVCARNSAAGAGASLTLVEPSPQVYQAIQVTGLAEVFGLAPAG